MEAINYFSDHHSQYIKDAAVTLTSGQQCLVLQNTHGEQPYQPTEIEKVKIDFLHGSVGLATELGEIFPLTKLRDVVHFKEEAGDLCWYMAIFDRHLLANNFKFEIPKYCKDMLLEEAQFDIQDLILNGLLDQSKKNFIYGKTYDLNLIHEKVMRVHGCIYTLCKFYGVSIEEVRDLNIAKLKKRYGDKFSAAAALNRDLDGELKVLQGAE